MSSTGTPLTKFTNCRLVKDGALVREDLWVSTTTGRIVPAPPPGEPAAVHDLGGRILSPGFVEVQLNGGYGYDFSVPSPDYAQRVATINRQLIKTGVTSFLPTLTSQRPSVYRQVLPHLGVPTTRDPADGAEILGVHAEGPFMNPTKRGIHALEVLQRPLDGIRSLEACYGVNYLSGPHPTIRKVTLAPELDPSGVVIRELCARGIVVAAGHSDASYKQIQSAVESGVTMVTHLFNAVRQPHHREPGIFGILGAQEKVKRPYFGIIADNIHIHPSMVSLAHEAHPEGMILVSDAMAMLGLPDGEYEWTNEEKIVKKGGELTLKGLKTIAGSCVTLSECLNNMLKWTETDVAGAVGAVTSTPAKMLGIEDTKGTLRVGADADLVVLSESTDKDGKTMLTVDEVWKFGEKVHSTEKITAKL